MEILFNKAGAPLMLNSTSFFGSTTGAPVRKLVQPFNQNDRYFISVDNYQVIPWGIKNDLPQHMAEKVRNTAVLNTGLKFLRNLTAGQGLYACTITGIDENGNEILSPVQDPTVTEFLKGHVVRRYMEKALRDYFKFGCFFAHFIPNAEGGLAGLNVLNAFYCRSTVPDSSGNSYSIVSGYWPLPPAEYEAIPMLNDYDPELYASLRMGKAPKGFLWAVRDSWSNEEIYSEPLWLPALLSGWVDIAHMVPSFLLKAYKNQITWKWHIQIPYSYWDQKFPEEDYPDVEGRKSAINKHMDGIEKNLCGAENAEKPLFTNYAVNEANGRVEEEWKITALDNKYKGGDNLVTSAAANSEILFSLMVNPNVLGAGMPGGSYAGNQGGSNIREAFLVNVANAWIDRENILDPIKLYMKLSGMPDCELRFRNTILTTLDTGAGTKKVLS